MLTSQSYIAPTADKTSSFNIPFELGLDEIVFLPKAKKELAVSLVNIQDTRCPDNVQCITPGSATAEIKLVSKSGSEAVRKLVLRECEKTVTATDTISVTLDNVNYSVILTEVNRLFASKTKVVVKKEAI